MLMLRLRGLFNSAYRHRKMHVSAMLLRLQFGGGGEADRGLFLQPTSASATRLRPDRRLNSQMTYAYDRRPELPVCACGGSKEATKKKLFSKQVAEEFNHSLLCCKPLLTV